MKNNKTIIIKTLPVKALQANKSFFYVCWEAISFVKTKLCVILSAFVLSMTQDLKN